MRIEKIEPCTALEDLRAQYMREATAALDGMWLWGLVPMADHYGLYRDDELAGYYCVNADGYMLQFFVSAQHRAQSLQLFEVVLKGSGTPHGALKGAFVSTAEPSFLSLCLDQSARVEVHALMYRLDDARLHSAAEDGASEIPSLVAVDASQLREAVDFAARSIGAPEDWLRGYYTTLIGRGELFGLWEDGSLIATGESRKSDKYQTDFVDVGMIVATSHRGKGVATQVLRRLAATNRENGLHSICSTEKANVAAQKAITRAGFVAYHRIVQFVMD